MILIDTNILLDVVTDDPVWADWSITQLERVAAQGALAINGVVYAELSVRFENQAELDAILAEAAVVILDTPLSALFLAGKAFQRYRAAGGARTGVLPDFFIGAHAAAMGFPLLTRDARRYRSYFPGIALIAP